MKVLIVKLTSMGDLVQALPALTDAWRAIPGIQFDWVVDEAFADIPAWHPAVGRVIKTAHRRWRDSLWQFTRQESRKFWGELRHTRYDAVIDAQTNLKSALVTMFAKGPKHGPDRHSVREKPAHWAYQHHYSVSNQQLAVNRWRELFSKVLNYPQPTGTPDFGLSGKDWGPGAMSLAPPYLVFVPNASWETKYWQDDSWRELLGMAVAQGYNVAIPWGSEKEKQRVIPFAEGYEEVTVLPRMTLTEIAGLMSGSAGTIAMDTGLAHVSAALAVPTVTLYGPTDPELIGATGVSSTHLQAGGYSCIPCYRRDCKVAGYSGREAQCLKEISPSQVWTAFQALASGC